MTIHLARVQRVARIGCIHQHLPKTETTHEINLLDLKTMKNEETAGASRGSRVPDRFHGRARFISFAGAAPALSLNFPPCRRTKETDGNGKHATWHRRGRRLRAINASAAIDGRRDIDLRYSRLAAK